MASFASRAPDRISSVRCVGGDPGACLTQRLLRDVDGDEVDPGMHGDQMHRLRPDAATDFEDAAAGGERRARVQQIGQRVGLVAQPLGFIG